MIRKSVSSDFEIYVKMAKEFYSGEAVIAPIPEENFRKTFELIQKGTSLAELFIIEYQNETAGYALTSKSYSQEGGGMCLWIEELFVIEKFRGKGLGNEFIIQMKKRIPDEFTRIRLEVELENTKAVNLYKKHGLEFFPYKQMIIQEKKP